VLPSTCPECTQDQRQFLKKGLGTQQAVQLFREIFPNARIERADLDTTSKKRSWRLTVEQFEKGDIDILIGTQTITKGYHFPGVALVGVLWADVNLHFPLFNASEVTLQQLIQVAGRAGRQHIASRVIVQTLRDHSIFNYLNEESYIDFCDREFLLRKETFYPPLCRLAHLELRHADAKQVDADADACAQFLLKFCVTNNLAVRVLGPARPLIARVQNIEMRHVYVKAQTFKDLHYALAHVQQQVLQSGLFVVMQ
jgi:primosomal protein N' (replication factor Y)